jgi:NADPH:quinone reductase-like Zn-dependent oxidoreductase
MNAAFINQHGGPEVLQYGDLTDPVAAPGEVVVNIFAASVNAADWKSRSGGYGQVKFPYVLGRDFSGVVSAVGPGVDDPRIGDEVFAVCEAGQEGAYAEKIAIKAAIVAKKPVSLSHIEATAVALTGLTALSAIEDTLKLKRRETILVQGGAGGVAGFRAGFGGCAHPRLPLYKERLCQIEAKPSTSYILRASINAGCVSKGSCG